MKPAMEIRGKPFLVTGGAGLVGSHIVDDLVRAGATEIRVYDNFARGKAEHLEWAQKNGNIVTIVGDIRDRDGIRQAMQGVEGCYHEAALWLRQCQERPRDAVDINITGTFNVLEACVNAKVKKVVAASSSSVYGEGLYLPTDENHPFNNDLFYGATKVATEQLYRSFYKKYGLDFVAFRYLNIYGPRQPFQAAYMDVIMHFLNRIDAGEPPRIEGDGGQTVDLVFVEDCARANILAMASDVTNECFNVASGRETSLKELAEILLELCGRKDLKPVYVPRDAKLVSRRLGCPKKAERMLGFRTQTSVREGMSRVIAWRKDVQARQTG